MQLDRNVCWITMNQSPGCRCHCKKIVRTCHWFVVNPTLALPYSLATNQGKANGVKDALLSYDKSRSKDFWITSQSVAKGHDGEFRRPSRFVAILFNCLSVSQLLTRLFLHFYSRSEWERKLKRLIQGIEKLICKESLLQYAETKSCRRFNPPNLSQLSKKGSRSVAPTLPKCRTIFPYLSPDTSQSVGNRLCKLLAVR